MPNNTPLVSVVISVLNGAATLDHCLNSIAVQTYTNLEVIGIDDGSTDQTLAIFKQWKQNHPQIPTIILQNKPNKGLAASLNRGIKAARGPYIARIDADDLWHPTKLALQLDYLAIHPQTGVLGTAYQNTYQQHKATVSLPTTDQDIRLSMFRRNPFGHSTVMMKKSLIQQVGGYNETLRYGQDRDLWFRLMPIAQFANLSHVLCTRHVDPTNSTTHKQQQILQSIRTTHRYIKKYHASPINYLYLAEPAASVIAPTWVRKLYRRIR